MAVTLLAVLSLWRASKSERYLRNWGMGYLLICAGLALSAVRDLVPATAAIVIVANVVMVVGGLLVMNGVAVFVDRPHSRGLLATVVMAVAVAFLFLVLVWPNLQARVVLMAVVFGAISLRMAWLLWCRVSPGLVGMQRTLAGLIALQLLHYTMMASTALVPTGALGLSDAPAAHNAIYLNASIVFVLLLFGFTGLAHRRLQLRLEHAAHHDPLTGVLNRRAIDLHLQRAVTRPPLSVLLLDLDHFKRLNDRFGHAVGDAALAAFAQAAHGRLRVGDVLGRVGGEEFCLVLAGTDGATAVAIAERLRQTVSDLSIPGAPDARLSVSIGVAIAEQSAPASPEQIVKAADEALYAAKAAGRDRVAAMRLGGENQWSAPALARTVEPQVA